MITMNPQKLQDLQRIANEIQRLQVEAQAWSDLNVRPRARRSFAFVLDEGNGL